MLFTHGVQPACAGPDPVVTHVDGSAASRRRPGRRAAGSADASRFADKTGIPVVVNTSLNTAGADRRRPRDALECFGCVRPVDLLALGPFAVRRCSLDVVVRHRGAAVAARALAPLLAG
jgi:carbamoyltransferase